MSRTYIIIWAAIIGLLVSLGWAVSHYRDNATEYKRQRDEKSKDLDTANSTISKMDQQRRNAEELDAKYTKELADAKAKNDALQRKLDNGGRVFVKGKCSVPATTETVSSPGMGNDGTIELSSTAGRNVLGIRSGIVSDQTALRALQDYVKQVCLSK